MSNTTGNFYIHNIVEEIIVSADGRWGFASDSDSDSPKDTPTEGDECIIRSGFYFSPFEGILAGWTDSTLTGPFDSEAEALIACHEQGPSICVSLTLGCPGWRSKRKPHSHIAGYVCERKHPAGGHLVIYDATKQDMGEIEDLGGRWVVVWEGCPNESGASIGPGHTNLPAARSFVKVEASGVRFWDWGDGLFSDGQTDPR
ncbi:MAG TPA: hypothetical protein EYQ27_15180 [Gemmatimonadetes bacterium]|nr:hypothetical protein [Gemmatimonadota bacterium]